MLFADKQNLETDLKVRDTAPRAARAALRTCPLRLLRPTPRFRCSRLGQVSLLAIRERELDLYTDNCRNIGAQAALLAGFAFSAINYEVADVNDVCTAYLALRGDCEVASRSVYVAGLYQLFAFCSMMLNFAAAFGSTFASMLGPGLALRGQDGAMDQAVEGLALEYRTTFLLFLSGIFSYFMCFLVFFLVDYDEEFGWDDLLLHLLLVAFFIYFVRSTLTTMKRIWKKFRLPPEVAVTGAFDPDAPGGVRGLGRSPESLELDRLSVRKTWREWPRRQYLYCTIFMDEFLGISSKVFQERYQKSAREKVSTSGRGRPKNSTLHTIIRYLERPSASSTAALGSPHHTVATRSADSPTRSSSTVIGESTWHPGPNKQSGFTAQPSPRAQTVNLPVYFNDFDCFSTNIAIFNQNRPVHFNDFDCF